MVHRAIELKVTGLGGEKCSVEYNCPCGCHPTLAYDHSQPMGVSEACCCGRVLLVGQDAFRRIGGIVREKGTKGRYDLERDFMRAPWGSRVEVALGTPREPVKH